MEKKKRRVNPYRAALATGIVLVILGLCISGVLVSYYSYTNAMNVRYLDYAKSVAKLALDCIDPDDMNGYLEKCEAYGSFYNGETATPAEREAYQIFLADNVKDEKYYASEASLAKILEGLDSIEYLYISQPRADRQYMIFDIDTPYVDGYELGETVEYLPYFEPVLPALLRGESIDPLISDDKFGWLMTVYVPFTDSMGAYAGHVGIDINMEVVVSEREGYLTNLSLIMASIAVFASVACILLFLSMMRKREAFNEQLIVAAEKAEAGSRAKSDFLARMSHEIRTPMNAIIGLTALSQKSLDDKQVVAEYLKKTEYSSKMLLSLINDILDMSAIENNKMKIAHVHFSMKQLLTTITSVYSDQCAAKGISFDVVVPTDFADELIGDQLRVNQILLNLLSNAVKFTPKGGAIKVVLEELTQDIPDGSHVRLRFKVSDNGCGMSQEMLGRLFKPFEQESSTTAQKFGGTGLGMSIAKNLSEMMGGSISVDSTLGEGTTFTVEIPFEESEAEQARERQQGGQRSLSEMAPAEEEHFDFKGKHVLLAEDNEINREIAVAQLEAAGFVVEAAEDGKQAVDRFDARAIDYYDLILMDVQMPIMDGYTATREIRGKDRADAKTVLIVAMTANAFVEDVADALNAGMDAHIAKPIEPIVLYKTLNKLLAERKKGDTK